MLLHRGLLTWDVAFDYSLFQVQGRLGAVGIDLVFETHSTTEDNESGHATGWLPGQLSERGRALARELGERRAGTGIAAVFCSDLARAVQTAQIAFAGTGIPILHDWRLRECDYGERNGMSAAEMHAARRDYLDVPYPGGESWRQAVARVSRFLGDLPLRWEGKRVAIIGHVATRWGLDHCIRGVCIEDLVAADFAWQPGWEYRLDT
jgi:2,3-bisphosphoglycerate-dependent phosphoglycerate mutase